jgi:hypothetical protein
MVALGRTCTLVAVVPLSGPSRVPLATRAEDTHAIRTFRRNSPPPTRKDQTCAGADCAPGTWAANLSSGLNDLPAAGVSRRAVRRESAPARIRGPLASMRLLAREPISPTLALSPTTANSITTLRIATCVVRPPIVHGVALDMASNETEHHLLRAYPPIPPFG